MTSQTGTAPRSAILVLMLAVVGTAAMAEGAPSSANPLSEIAWRPIEAKDVAASWERIKSLEGTWKGTSTKGWTGLVELQPIAKGSVVLSTFRFLGAPNDGMATVYHLDGGDLVLTHYCEAGNQPRLKLTEIDPSGDVLHFEFTGGGNLPTRDPGHMDELILRLGMETMNSRWTWHADGVSSWMEDIEYRRVSELDEVAESEGSPSR